MGTREATFTFPLTSTSVLDNLSVHKAPPVANRPAHPRRARRHLHFTPASSSWLNLIERWFAEPTERRRGVFTSVGSLFSLIENWNHDPEPFVWHKPAEEIIAKIQPGRAALTQAKSATCPRRSVRLRSRM